jgi:hypothetical protein
VRSGICIPTGSLVTHLLLVIPSEVGDLLSLLDRWATGNSRSFDCGKGLASESHPSAQDEKLRMIRRASALMKVYFLT